MNVYLNPQSMIVLLFVLIITIISLTYVSNQAKPEYNDWKRTLMLILGIIITVYSVGSLSIKIYLLSKKYVKFTDIIIPLTFNILSITLGSIIVDYSRLSSNEWDKKHTDKSWEKDTIQTLSIVVLIFIISMFAMYFLANLRGNKELEISIKGLTPYQKDAITI
jgi:hypothetical protein